jgi:hypothetical protein
MRYLLVLICLLASQVQAGSAQLLMPAEKTIEACQMRLSIDGRVIGHMRWDLGYDREKAHANFTPNGAPTWYVNTVRGWIDSAYRAGDKRGDAKTWFETEWAGCEGSGA